MFRDKHGNRPTIGEESILGDVQAAELRTSVELLAGQVAALEEQMRSQFTSVATYAAIAQEQCDFVRNEARADLERTRNTLIQLIEQLRAEVSGGTSRALPVPSAIAPPTA